jgi:molecular chaperone DnaK
MSTSNEYISVGIDLGTSNCCVTYLDQKGKIQIIKQDPSSNEVTIASIIDVTNIEDGLVRVGNEIDKNHIHHNKNIFHSFKRLIGHTIEDLRDTSDSNIMEILSYKIDSSDNTLYCYDTNDRAYSLCEVIFLLLRKLKQLIVDHFEKLDIVDWKCIVTVPAYFDETQRQITMDAIRITNLPLLKLLNEPTSASFAYLYHNRVLEQETFNKKIMVIDYGAGTLDLTVLEITRDNEDMDGTLCEVLGSYGDNNFGGIDITKRVYKSLFHEDNYDVNLKMQIAETMKLILSSQQNAEYYCTELDKTFTYPYEEFIHQLKPFSNKIISIIESVLEISEVTKEEIDDIVLVGGSFKNTYFRRQISEYFEKQINQPRIKLSNREQLLYEDIAVSAGAAIHGYYLLMAKDVVLVDRIALSVGVETINKEVVQIIERNSIIPTKKTKIFSTDTEEETCIDIDIYQGESLFSKNCRHVGKFQLSGIPVRKRAKATIYINIEVDENGLITVNAYDKRNIAQSSYKISSKNTAMSDENIEKIMMQYEQNIFSEQLHKNIIKSFYDLINIVDKVSFQINYNESMDLTEAMKEMMRKDAELIVNKMNNQYVMKKYAINKKLIAKVIVLNKLKYYPKEYVVLDELEIEEFGKLLNELRFYLIDKYDMFLKVEYDMTHVDQVGKHEVMDDNDDNINTGHHEFTVEDADEIEIGKFSAIINRFSTVVDVSDNSIKDYDELSTYLLANINNFNLTDEGVMLLEAKLGTIDSTNCSLAIDELNEYCIYLMNTFSMVEDEEDEIDESNETTNQVVDID